MANRSTPEDRHKQSVRRITDVAAENGWATSMIEADGIRQYRFSRGTQVSSAYFFMEDEENGTWKYVTGFIHGDVEPLKMMQFRTLLETPFCPTSPTGHPSGCKC